MTQGIYGDLSDYWVHFDKQLVDTSTSNFGENQS